MSESNKEKETLEQYSDEIIENAVNQESEKECEDKNESKDEVKDEVKEKKQQKKHDDSKKLNKIEKALAKAEAERDSFKDSYQRTFSEFNNFKKRNQTAASLAVKTGSCDTLEKIIPVLDNFERALEQVDGQEDNAFAKGMRMVYKQLLDIIEGMGVKEIPSLGELFDPNLHQAIQQMEAEEGVEANTVVTVVQKGYMVEERILRHSMVIVSK